MGDCRADDRASSAGVAAGGMLNVREMLNGSFYVLATGYQWLALPKDLPPKSTSASPLHAVSSVERATDRSRHETVSDR